MSKAHYSLSQFIPINLPLQAEQAMSHTFAIHYQCGPAWVHGKTVFEQPLQDHLAYMHQLVEAGILRMGGPFLDNTGGLIVLTANTEQEASELAAADPAIRNGLMRAQTHPWKLIAGKELVWPPQTHR
jgi:uncharacterized protein YciI